jgi:hypothetical protein
MTKLTNPVALLSRSNGAAVLTAIDAETKTCTVYNGKEKIIKWSSAAEYKLDTGSEKTRTLTPKLLAALLDAEAVNHKEAATQEPTSEPDDELQGDAQDVTAAEEDATPAAGDGQEAAEQPKAKRTRTPKGTISDKEKIFLSLIPTHPDFKGVDSELVSRVIIKQAAAHHGLPIPQGRAVFQSLRAKGYYSAKGRESGVNLTTLQLTEQGIRYLTDNNLLPAVAQ